MEMELNAKVVEDLGNDTKELRYSFIYLFMYPCFKKN